MDRRQFLKRKLTIVAGCAFSGGVASFLAGCASLRYVDHTVVDGRVAVLKTAFGEDQSVLLDLPERLSRPIYLQRVGRDDYLALSTRCTHRGCQVEPQADRLVCPCHGSEFSLTGAVVQGPADRDLLRFAVEVDQDRIYIELPPSGDQNS